MIMLGLRVAAIVAFVFAITGFSTYFFRPEVANASSASATKRVLLKRLGPPRSDTVVTGKSALKSVLNIRRSMRFGSYIWDEQDVPAGLVEVRVDLAKQIISVSRDGHEIGTAVILYGADEKPTPSGRFSILEKRKQHRSSLYDADMPYTLRLTNDGVSIHGSDVRRNLATHGCIGVPIEFAALLFDQVKIADEVVIVGA